LPVRQQPGSGYISLQIRGLMLLGIQVSSFTWPGTPAETGSTFRRIAVDAEQAGLASLWVMDHFFQISMIGPPEEDMLEG